MRQEKLRTIIAAACGLPLGLALSIGYPLVQLFNHRFAWMELFFASVAAPPLVGIVQFKAKNYGWLFLSEFLGYIGAGLGLVGTLCCLPGASVPLMFLASLYEDQGRLHLCTRVYDFSRLTSKLLARSSNHHDMKLPRAISNVQFQSFTAEAVL